MTPDPTPTARDLLAAALHEAKRGNAGNVWVDDIADTPSGAELLRRADEPREHGLDDITDAQLDPHSRQFLRRADEPRVAEGLERLVESIDYCHKTRHLRHSDNPRHLAPVDCYCSVNAALGEARAILALPAPRPPEPDRTAALVEALERCVGALGYTVTNVAAGGTNHWCRLPHGHEATCSGMLATITHARSLLASTPEPSPVADGTEP